MTLMTRHDEDGWRHHDAWHYPASRSSADSRPGRDRSHDARLTQYEWRHWPMTRGITLHHVDAVGDQHDPGCDGSVGHVDRSVAAAVLLLLLLARARRRLHSVRLVLRLPLSDRVPAHHLSHGFSLAHRRTCRPQVRHRPHTCISNVSWARLSGIQPLTSLL